MKCYLNDSTNDVNTSFKAKKDRGYFILVNSMGLGQVSIQPYTLTLFDHKHVDEDADSKLVNGVPSKPSVLVKRMRNGLQRNI